MVNFEMLRKCDTTMSSAFFVRGEFSAGFCRFRRLLRLLPIKVFALNNFFHRLGYEITNRFVFRNSPSYLSGGMFDGAVNQLVI